MEINEDDIVKQRDGKNVVMSAQLRSTNESQRGEKVKSRRNQ